MASSSGPRLRAVRAGPTSTPRSSRTGWWRRCTRRLAKAARHSRSSTRSASDAGERLMPELVPKIGPEVSAVASTETHALRRAVLRDGDATRTVVYPEDDLA